MKRIHVVGVSPRTGTTLMAEAIKTCFTIDSYTSHETSLFSRPRDKSDIFLTKRPGDIMVVGPSLRFDPHLFVICMIRDPRDIISSKHRKDPDRYWASLKYWNLYIREVEKLKEHPRFIPVHYEFFVSNPDKVQAMISDKIPFLEKLHPFNQYHEVADVSDLSEEALRNVRPIKPTSVGKWRKHKSRVAGQLKLHGPITDDLIKYGYEENEQWLSELEGIKPDLNPGHFPEYMTAKEKINRRFGRYLEAFRRFIENIIGYRIRITHPEKWL